MKTFDLVWLFLVIINRMYITTYAIQLFIQPLARLSRVRVRDLLALSVVISTFLWLYAAGRIFGIIL